MFDLARGYFRKTLFRTYRYLKHPRRLKASPLLRWFSRHFLDKHVWKPTAHTFAGGAAIGALVMMQLVPGQMPVAAILAALFRVNIPIAIMTCWITNPVTMVPTAVAEIHVGNWLLGILGHATEGAPDMESARGLLHFVSLWLRGLDTTGALPGDGIPTLFSWLKSMLVGGLVSGAVMGVIGYFGTLLLWQLFVSAKVTVKTTVAARRASHAHDHVPVVEKKADSEPPVG
jgi:uncharacterized protein (DUF2062 family)